MDMIWGGIGDDKLYGGDGMDTIWGDDENGLFFGDDKFLLFGDDKIFGGDGMDTLRGGNGDDIIHGDGDDDTLKGGPGEDTLYGGDGQDTIDAGKGWDTIFGGDGCDTITTYDGGDIVWLGDCDGTISQTLTIQGTGDDPENFVVVMDFWLESAKPFNEICLIVGDNQNNPSAARCNKGDPTFGIDNFTQRENNDGICVSATDIADPEQLYNDFFDRSLEPGEWRGSGCKHDGGPLWISIPIVDDPVVAQETRQQPSNYYYNNARSGTYFQNDGGNSYAQTIWARFFQRAPKKPIISKKIPRITSYNNPERYEYSSRYES